MLHLDLETLLMEGVNLPTNQNLAMGHQSPETHRREGVDLHTNHDDRLIKVKEELEEELESQATGLLVGLGEVGRVFSLRLLLLPTRPVVGPAPMRRT